MKRNQVDSQDRLEIGATGTEVQEILNLMKPEKRNQKTT